LPEAAEGGDFDIHVETGSAEILIRVKGEVDLSNAPASRRRSTRRATRRPAGPIVIELSGLEFIDSTGLSVLIAATRRSRENGNRLRVRRASGQVRRILEVAGVHDWLFLDEVSGGQE
jgi:anti-sigma B factor antagonist